MTMSEQYFDYLPRDVNFLEQLTNSGSLTRPTELKIAVRSWVILDSLYVKGNFFDKKEFDLSEWLDYFFKDNAILFKEKYRDRKPLSEDLNQYPFNLTIKSCLFDKNHYFQNPQTGEEYNNEHLEEEWKEWEKHFKEHYWYSSTINFDDLDRLYPFQCTGRSISDNFEYLLKKGWLLNPKNSDKKYQTLSQIPSLETNDTVQKQDDLRFFMDEDDAYQTMVDKFNQPINGTQRLFFYYDYKILDNTTHKKVSYCRDKLKAIWTQTPAPILNITYKSSRLGGQESFYLIYPVCIYYHQRSFYLIAFGQFPQQSTDQSNWYNYRLDRIQSIQELDKNDENLPQDIKDKSKEDQETLIYDIQDSMEEAYGFDFYLDQDTMLLRFPSEFHKNYISNTVRHRTFKKIDANKALAMVEKNPLSEKQKDQLKAQIGNHPDDGYYTLQYRKNENSVIMRLRAWCPNVEVLLPWDLRQRMKNDMQKTWELYKNDD